MCGAPTASVDSGAYNCATKLIADNRFPKLPAGCLGDG